MHKNVLVSGDHENQGISTYDNSLVDLDPKCLVTFVQLFHFKIIYP